MKSEHRHELETNVLAHGLEAYVERIRPYFGKVVGGLLGLVAVLFIWSYVSGSSAARHSGAWDAYNSAIGSLPPNLDQLRQTAEENPNTAMQRLADLTWADGQVYISSRSYVANRTAANEALNKAASAYQGVIQSSTDPQLTGRARLGLARVYEMQNELEKARAQYDQVTGTFGKYAKTQAERLAKPEAKETYAWLATAQPPVSRPPVGPGTPGKPPEFSAGDISLPTATDTTANPAENAPNAAQSLENLLQDMQKDSKSTDGVDRYKTEPPADGASPASAPPAAESKDGTAPASGDAPKAEASPPPPAEEKAAK